MNLETRNPMMSVSVRMRSPAVIYRRYFISSGRTANDVCTVGLYCRGSRRYLYSTRSLLKFKAPPAGRHVLPSTGTQFWQLHCSLYSQSVKSVHAFLATGSVKRTSHIAHRTSHIPYAINHTNTNNCSSNRPTQ